MLRRRRQLGHHAPPPPLPGVLYTGTMEIAGQMNLDLADIKPGMIRLMKTADSSVNVAKSRSAAITAADIMPLPCLRTDGWRVAVGGGATEADGLNAFEGYLHDWAANVDESVLWFEIGNEPTVVYSGDAQTAANVRKMYFDYCTRARTVLDSHGKLMVLSAQISASGNTGPVWQAITDGDNSMDWDIFDGVAIHPYAQTPADVYDSVFGYRTLLDTHDDTKPLFITEVGWPCSYSANGSRNDTVTVPPAAPSEWNNQPSNHLHVNQVISQNTQKNDLVNTFNLLIPQRSTLNLRAILWFAAHDYGIPDGTWDRHCGLIDPSEGKRQSYNGLKAYPTKQTSL